jgi:hypothetical protein
MCKVCVTCLRSCKSEKATEPPAKAVAAKTGLGGFHESVSTAPLVLAAPFPMLEEK